MERRHIVRAAGVMAVVGALLGAGRAQAQGQSADHASRAQARAIEGVWLVEQRLKPTLDATAIHTWSGIVEPQLIPGAGGQGRRTGILSTRETRDPATVAYRQVLGVPSNSRLMFPEHEGGPWDQRNALRSFYVWQDRLDLSPRVGFHRLRHTCATEYLRRGGELVRLSRSLGHTQITTTMNYLQLLTEDLSREHVKVSLLSRGR